MSNICVAAIISILIFVSTSKQLTQSETLEFSKNGVFHNKRVVIILSLFKRDQKQLEKTTNNTENSHHFTPLLQKIYRNRVNQIPEQNLLTKILDIKTNLNLLFHEMLETSQVSFSICKN